VVARGTTTARIAVRLIATTTRRLTVTTISAFASVVFRSSKIDSRIAQFFEQTVFTFSALFFCAE